MNLISRFGGRIWDPWREMGQLQHEMNRLFAGTRSFTGTPPREYPPVNLHVTENELLLTLELPGVDPSQVDITVEKNVLTLKGVVSDDHPPGYELGYEEYGVGDYERSFTLSNEVDRDGITAAMKDGVLRLTLPKAKQAVARKVAVTAG